jgi:hypothetical protein
MNKIVLSILMALITSSVSADDWDIIYNRFGSSSLSITGSFNITASPNFKLSRSITYTSEYSILRIEEVPSSFTLSYLLSSSINASLLNQLEVIATRTIPLKPLPSKYTDDCGYQLNYNVCKYKSGLFVGRN